MNNSGSRKRKLGSTTVSHLVKIHISSCTGGMNIPKRNGAMMGNSGSMNIPMRNSLMIGTSGSTVSYGNVQPLSIYSNYGGSFTQSSTSGTTQYYSSAPVQPTLTTTQYTTSGSNYQGTNYQGTNYQCTNYQGTNYQCNNYQCTNYQKTSYLSAAQSSYCSNICAGGNALIFNQNNGAIHMNSSRFDTHIVNVNNGAITMNCGYPSQSSAYTNASMSSYVATSGNVYVANGGNTFSATSKNGYVANGVYTYAATSENGYVANGGNTYAATSQNGYVANSGYTCSITPKNGYVANGVYSYAATSQNGYVANVGNTYACVATSENGYVANGGNTYEATSRNGYAVKTINSCATNTSNTYVSTEPLQKRSRIEITSAASENSPRYRSGDPVLLVDDECFICYETYKKIEDNMAALTCGHYFHKECLDKWLVICNEVDNTCPLCRKNALTGESV